MKVNELIERLQKLPNQDALVEIAVGTATQVYPQAYVSPFEVSQGGNGCRIYVHLEKGQSISTRKAAQ